MKLRVYPEGGGPRTSSLYSTTQHRSNEYVSASFKIKKKLPPGQLFNIMRRLVAVAAAIQYDYVSFSATWWALAVLSGAQFPTETFRVFPSSLLEGYLGNREIVESPIVQGILGGDTTPRDHVLFLATETETSTSGCTEVPLFNPKIYNYNYLSQRYLGMVANTKHNITILDDFELVLIVVDCSFRQIKVGDSTDDSSLVSRVTILEGDRA